jgi:hypothetical protein
MNRRHPRSKGIVKRAEAGRNNRQKTAISAQKQPFSGQKMGKNDGLQLLVNKQQENASHLNRNSYKQFMGPKKISTGWGGGGYPENWGLEARRALLLLLEVPFIADPFSFSVCANGR